MEKTRKMFVLVILSLFICSVCVSNASATDDDITSEPTPDLAPTNDIPMLIATQNGTLSGDEGTLYQTNENSTMPTEPPINNSEESGDVLIATQSTPDYIGYTIVGVVLAILIVVGAFIIIKKRR